MSIEDKYKGIDPIPGSGDVPHRNPHELNRDFIIAHREMIEKYVEEGYLCRKKVDIALKYKKEDGDKPWIL
jgi:hypothetical protein